MINIIVMGHGGYAEGIKNNLYMLSGVLVYALLDITLKVIWHLKLI